MRILVNFLIAWIKLIITETISEQVLFPLYVSILHHIVVGLQSDPLLRHLVRNIPVLIGYKDRLWFAHLDQWD